MSKQSKVISVTRTVRIDEKIDLLIQGDAERQGMSTNALINKILLQYKDVMRFTEPPYFLMLSLETLGAMLNLLTIEEIGDIGYEYGYKKLHENLLKRGREIDYENIRWYIIQELGEYSGWFKCEYFEKKDVDIFHLSHNMGRKWSHFLGNYITSILQGELKFKVQSIILENNVHLTVTK